jgi:chemotaxis protein histidine kinase CheA
MSKSKKSNKSDKSNSTNPESVPEAIPPKKTAPKLELVKLISPKKPDEADPETEEAKGAEAESKSDAEVANQGKKEQTLAKTTGAKAKAKTQQIVAIGNTKLPTQKEAKATAVDSDSSTTKAAKTSTSKTTATSSEATVKAEQDTSVTSVTSTTAATETPAPAEQADHNQDQEPQMRPIPPATESMQYRAIGVVYGRYVPEEEQFSRGKIISPDGSEVDTVLLGKVISIVKKRLDLEKEYLWVVYPRTRSQTNELHLQIAGVWAPLEMGKPDQPVDPDMEDGYFSIRGEIIRQLDEEGIVHVKIRRMTPPEKSKPSKKRDDKKPPANKFKLTLKGMLPPDAVGYFWNLNVRREGNDLKIIDGESIGTVPKPKPKPFKGRKGAGGGGGGRKPPGKFQKKGKFGGKPNPNYKRDRPDTGVERPERVQGEGSSKPVKIPDSTAQPSEKAERTESSERSERPASES